jgi:glycerol-3-phosphate dehydrogenase
MKRKDMVTAMDDRSTVWDIIIIGGGATGLGAAVEAASRGYRTVLVEADDFAKGTSSRSTKLIHGGVRYLRQGRIGMVRQSLRERSVLLHNAPHIVHSLDFVLPTYHRGSQAFYYAGLRLYDVLAGQWINGRTRRLSSTATSELLPNLQDVGLRGSVLYSDGQFDDARLAVTLARTAVDQGAVVANYLPVERLLKNGQRVSGVVVRDRETDRELSLLGRVVLNATGVFADDILRMDVDPQNLAVPDDQPSVTPSQGSHLVLDSSFLPGGNALMIPETDDGRVLFAIPWHGKVILGTTDISIRDISREPCPLRSEVDYLLEHAGRYLKRSPNESDICSRFAGLRPLVSAKSGSRSTSKLSREHEIHTSASGLITVIGGKWTTYRQMGEEMIDRAEMVGGLPRRESRTAVLPLHGCPTEPEFAAVPASTMNLYGSDSVAIRRLIGERPELSQPIHPRLPWLSAEVAWSARHEMARTVEDVLARRTRALFLDAKAAIDSANLVADLLQAEFHQSDEWKRSQIDSFLKVAAGYCGPTPPN